MTNAFFIEETESTNSFLKNLIRAEHPKEGFVVYTDSQTAGKGQVGNKWESAPQLNLTFSMVLYPEFIQIEEQFIISQLVSIAIIDTLHQYADTFTIKWPNDIYWKEKKIAGILIENSLQGGKIKSMIIGIGLNVNQTEFYSDAPNPISLTQITKQPHDRTEIMTKIRDKILHLYSEFDAESIHSQYLKNLFRKDGYFRYKSDDEVFEACIKNVHNDGRIELETNKGISKQFYFKEVNHIL